MITNGVSFSLVVGACCAIKFSSDPYDSNKSYTMNINSTGAKSISLNNYSFNTYYSGGRYMNPASNYANIYIYTGSNYIHNAPRTYNDYGDD